MPGSCLCLPTNNAKYTQGHISIVIKQQDNEGTHLADEVEKRLAFRAHQAGEELRNPCEPLDWRHSNAILIHSICQCVLIIKTQQPQYLGKRREKKKKGSGVENIIP